jgi:succinate dehydrogenase assembly factor 2
MFALRTLWRSARSTPVRALHPTTVRLGDPFPLPFDPALAAQHAAERAQRNPEEVIEGWAMPPPLDRTGETPEVLRARLVYQTRKRGTLENDLLFSTFAVQELPGMSVEEMKVFDKVGWRRGWGGCGRSVCYHPLVALYGSSELKLTCS